MIRYRLDDLGWYQFEWLCQSLLKIYSKRTDLEEQKAEKFTDPPDDYEPSGSRPTGGFDINELFSDL